MKINRNILTTLVLTMIMVCSAAQTFSQSKYNLPPNKYYEKAQIGLPEYKTIDVQSISLFGDSIRYFQHGVSYKKHLDDINFIKLSEKTKAAGGALIGAGSMLLLSLVAVASVESDPNLELKDDAGLRIGLYVLGGALAGVIVGSMFKRSEIFYVHISPMQMD